MMREKNSEFRTFLKILVSLGLIVSLIAIFPNKGFVQDHWPQEFAIQNGKIFVYQPQLESYKGDKIKGRAALSIQKKGTKDPVFGVVWFSARALTERSARMVEFTDMEVERIKFPQSTPEQERQLTEVLRQEAGKWMPTQMALDRLLTLTAAIEKGRIQADRLNMDPPKIIFTTSPSALILINGKPQLRKIENSTFERVINTPFLILFDPTNRIYYTRGGDFWYSAVNVMGPWENLNNPPAPVVELAGRIVEARENEDADQPKPKFPPQIIVATEPTELIVSEGEPKFAPLQGTKLLYMSNTPNEVFMEIRSQEYYVLLAGRWFQSRSLKKGPWTYVAPENLPQDFKKIPPGSSKGHILAFVAGTREAEEAVLDAQIPQTTAVQRNEAKLSVTYDGSPRFEPIKNTDMQYAVNTKTQVIKVKDKYYAVDQAVWFVSDSPTGPWVVADYVPPEVDTIPPESPVYNVKYVRVYDSTPEVVYVGYTPGYLGSYVYGDTIVYGTGYYYPGWFGTVYYPAPVTWGFAPIYDPFYCSWVFGWGYGAGFVSGFYWGFPIGIVVSPWWYGYYWAGWYPWYGYGYGYFWFGRYAWYHHYPYHGGHHHHYPGYYHPPHRFGHHHINRPINVSRPIHGPDRLAHGKGPGSNVYSPRQDRRDIPDQNLQRPGQNPNPRQENLGRNIRPPESRVDQDRRRVGEAPNRPMGYSRQPENNVFADRDGNVYRRTPQGWEQRTQRGWARPEETRQGPRNFEQHRPSLNRDYSARVRGNERTSDFGRVYGSFSRENPGRDLSRSGYGSYGRAPFSGSGYQGSTGFGRAPMGGGSRGGGPQGGSFRGTPRGGMGGGGFSGVQGKGDRH
jgi:hypothetical protein